MILYNKLGQPGAGRLGNSIFEIASCIGLAHKHETHCIFPEWKYEQYFQNPLPHGENISSYREIKEPCFHYHEFGGIDFNKNVNITGWLQSEKYWIDCKDKVKEQFKFNKEFSNSVVDKVHRRVFEKETIAISIRRGDYVGNPVYEQLPITYYLLALFENFPDWKEHNIIIFSDDSDYCKIHFGGLKNVFFTNHLTDIEQLCLMSMSNHFIISNSTFSWWGAYLGETDYTKIIRPNYLFRGRYMRHNDFRDFYPSRWSVYEHKENNVDFKKIDLSDVTFLIPLHYDHPDRAQNLFLTLCMLQRTFNTNYIIGEQGSNYFADKVGNCTYINFDSMENFHRTKMLNLMALRSKTKIFVNYDADITVPPMQMLEAINKIRTGEADVVYPYDGRFARVNRRDWFTKLEQFLDVGIFGKEKFRGTKSFTDKPSVGGCIAFNKEKFIEGGMENERMISYGPEDVERFERFTRLGFKVERIKGVLYHIDHFVGVNSSSKNPYFRFNHSYLDEMQATNDLQLKEHVSEFEWIKKELVD